MKTRRAVEDDPMLVREVEGDARGMAIGAKNALAGRPEDEALVDTVLVKHLEKRVIVAVVDMDTDDHRSLRVERLLHDRRDVVGLVNHETGRAECLGILDVVDWTEVDSRSAAVFELLLNGYHVVPAVDPDHMNDVRLEAHGRLQFHSGIEEAAIPGDRENLLR